MYMANIAFTKAKYRALQRAYDDAVREGKDTFTFEGHELATSYVKYMLEYMHDLFGEHEHG